MTQRNTTAQEPSDTGGPAFPRAATQEMMEADCFAEEGMTLLDYFAGQALNILDRDVAVGRVIDGKADDGYGGWTEEQLVAHEAYAIAAAMLAEKRRRERPPATAQGEQS